MLLYYILAIICIIILLIAFFKLKYPFWSKQPVFHFHNIGYWLMPPGIIQHGMPEKNKYYDETVLFFEFFQVYTCMDNPCIRPNLILKFLMNYDQREALEFLEDLESSNPLNLFSKTLQS